MMIQPAGRQPARRPQTDDAPTRTFFLFAVTPGQQAIQRLVVEHPTSKRSPSMHLVVLKTDERATPQVLSSMWPNLGRGAATKNYGWEILGFGQDDLHQTHGVENFCCFVVHIKVSWRKHGCGAKLVVYSAQKFRDLYNVHCFTFEWRRTIQAMEHGSGATTMGHGFWKLSAFCWFCVESDSEFAFC
jgi:hypothetical protein